MERNLEIRQNKPNAVIPSSSPTMLLESLLPTLPTTIPEILIYIVATLGAILLPYSVFVEAENRSDLIRTIGAVCLLVYSIYIRHTIFAIAMGGLAIASIIEFIEIYLGIHQHSPEDLKKFKRLGRLQ